MINNVFYNSKTEKKHVLASNIHADNKTYIREYTKNEKTDIYKTPKGLLNWEKAFQRK